MYDNYFDLLITEFNQNDVVVVHTSFTSLNFGNVFIGFLKAFDKNKVCLCNSYGAGETTCFFIDYADITAIEKHILKCKGD